MANDLLGAIQCNNQRPDRHLTLTDAEEHPNEVVARWRHDDPFTILLVLNPLARLKGMRLIGTHEILGW
jgi:hypothetical protein